MQDSDYKNTKFTYNKRAKNYSVRADQRGLDTRFADDFKNLLKGNHILDVGCADGKYSRYFLDNGFKVTGIDFSSEFITMAKSNCPEGDFHEMDLLNIKLEEQFDGIWAAAVLLHIKRTDIHNVLTSLKTLLKPEGLLFISLIAGEGHNLVESNAGLEGKRLFVYYGKEEFANLLKQAGLIVEKTEESNFMDQTVWLNYFVRNN